MEIDPLLTMVQEMGAYGRCADPDMDMVLVMVKQRGEMAGLYTRPKQHDSAEHPAVAAQ